MGIIEIVEGITGLILVVTIIVCIVKHQNKKQLNEYWERYYREEEKIAREYEKHIREATPKNYEGLYRKRFIMTMNEKEQFWKIKKITDKLGLLLFTKVRMLDLVEPINNNYTLINKIIRKHVDFVIIDKKGYTLCVIEIDDKSHMTKDRIENDRIKDAILNGAGIWVTRVLGIDEVKLENMLKGMTKKDAD